MSQVFSLAYDELPPNTQIVMMPDYEIKDCSLYFLGERERPLDSKHATLLQACNYSNSLSIEDARKSYGDQGLEFLFTLGSLGYLAFKPPCSHQPSVDTPILIVSPHMDDAFLSLAGTILTQRGRDTIHIHDLIGDDPWCTLHERFWPTRSKLVDLRQKEEQFCAWLCDCRIKFSSHPSSPQRGHKIWNGPLNPTLDDLVKQHILDEIDDLLTKTKWELVMWPLGVGGHVDHRLIRMLAQQFVEMGHPCAAKFVFYEDLPYASFLFHWQTWPPTELLTNLVPKYIPISQSLGMKRHLLDVYRSQLVPSEPEAIIRYASPTSMVAGMSHIDQQHFHRHWQLGAAYERIWLPVDHASAISDLLLSLISEELY